MWLLWRRGSFGEYKAARTRAHAELVSKALSVIPNFIASVLQI